MTSPVSAARRWLLDAALCLPFLVVGLAGTRPAADNQPAASDPDAVAYALVVVAALAVAARRRPGLSLAVNGTAVAAYLVAGYPYGPILLTVPAVVLLAAAAWPARRAAASVGGYLGVVLAAALVKDWREPAAAGGIGLLWLVLVWSAIVAAALAVGMSVRVRREAAAGVRAEQARRAASEERLRMARDLHDSVGHGLAVIAMQTGVALHVLDRDPERARESLEAARATSRESLESLRAELAALRSPETAGARRPGPGLEDAERLAERVRAGGVAVRLDIDPDLPALPPAVDAVAYRILQESLTNVLRHAGSATAADPGAGRARVAARRGHRRRPRANRRRSAVHDGRPEHQHRPEWTVRHRGRPTARRCGRLRLRDPGDAGAGRGAGRHPRRRTARVRRVHGHRPAAAGRPGGPVRPVTQVIRVVVVDDQAVVRMGVRTLLGSEPDTRLVGEGVDGRTGVDVVRATTPDVVLMDIRMPRVDGLAALREITADPALAGVRVVMLTTFGLDEYVFEALRGGASGFVLKDAEPEELLRAVRVVADGGSLLSPSVTRSVIARFARQDPAAVRRPGLDQLTEREREVVGWVATGLSNDEIAARLVVSRDTVRTHVSRAMLKLHARDRAQLVVFAMQSGLAPPA